MKFPAQQPLPLGKYFLQSSRITSEQLEQALAFKQERGLKLGQALTALGLVTEQDVIEALRQQGKIHCINLTPEIVDPQVATQLGERESRRFRAVAINRIARYTTVAMVDPSDVYAIDELGMKLDTRVLPVYAEPKKIDEAIEHVFKRAHRLDAPELTRSVDKLAEMARQAEPSAGPIRLESTGARSRKDVPVGKNLRSGADVSFEATEAEPASDQELGEKPVINLVRGVLAEAYLAGASDVHLEPRREDFLIRFRIDGTLFDRTTVPRSWAGPIVARIKVLANLDIAQRRLPQDGRTQFRYKGQRVDLRIATTPTLHGEGVVLRILDGGRKLQNLDSLDLDQAQLDTVERIIQCRDGFVLATGPTGSGKTTTLYAVLDRLNSRDRKIITLEDPVENEMDGVTQINAYPKIGLTFAKGLRSILRQDPDIVLVGEIRDEETASIAVQAALTGHIVLSTLHTVGSAETITRLTDMGIEPYLLADSLRGIVSQRLLRRICVQCKAPVAPKASILSRLGLFEADGPFYAGRGCDACHGLGYQGRIGVYEIMQMTAELCRLVQRNVATEELQQAALEAGLTTLREDGIRKARAGATTLAEVLSATTRG